MKLGILDLASFRLDGRVRFDAGQMIPPELLVGQARVYPLRVSLASEFLDKAALRPIGSMIAPGLQLSFAIDGQFKHIFTPVFEDATETKAHGVTTSRPKRITWRLRRCGRIRMPYATALLDQYTTVASRQAFELDYLAPR